MSFDDFMRRERNAVHRFMCKHVTADFLSPAGSYSYSREYRCDCGYRTDDPRAIYEHRCAAPVAERSGADIRPHVPPVRRRLPRTTTRKDPSP